MHYKKSLLYTTISLIGIFLLSCKASSIHDLTVKYPPSQLQYDVSTLKNVLEANHPSLYWYTTKDSLDAAFNSVIESITDSLTEEEFRRRVAWAVSRIRCGHTSVRFSKRYASAFNKAKPPVFPLALKAWDDSLVVLASAFKGDSVFTRGTIITAINGIKPKYILDSMFQLINTDGYANNLKNQVISFNFGTHYRNTFGLDSIHVIHFLDNHNKQRTVLMRNFEPSKDTLRSGRRTQVMVPNRRQIREAEKLSRRSMVIDTPLNTAYIRVATFSSGKLKRFFRKTFKTIRQNNLNNVVIDLRENGGGNIMSSIKLSQYMVNKPYKVADTVAAISRSFKYGEHIRPSLAYKISMFFTSRRKHQDGRYHFRYFEKHHFKPKKRNHFAGNIYLIQGGYSFSATTLFINSLKGQPNVKVVGEESGGAGYGNSAVHLPQVILPNTKLRVVLPVYRLVIDADLPKTGRGIFPDIEVPPSSAYMKLGIDPKIDTVKELIRKDMNRQGVNSK